MLSQNSSFTWLGVDGVPAGGPWFPDPWFESPISTWIWVTKVADVFKGWVQRQFTQFKGSSDQSYFMFEIIVGKSRIQNITSLNLNDTIVNRFKSL